MKRFGFGKEVRLHKKREFLKVYSQGKKAEDDRFIFFALPRENDRVRFGITVSRRVGSPVVRNRVKRVVREACRLYQEQILPGYDIVIVAKRGIGYLDYRETQESFLRLTRKLGLKKPGEPSAVDITQTEDALKSRPHGES